MRFRLGVILFVAVTVNVGNAQEWSAERGLILTEPAGPGSFWGSISGVESR